MPEGLSAEQEVLLQRARVELLSWPLDSPEVNLLNRGIDLAVELSEDWSGAALVAQGDGALLGCLVWNDGQPEIALMPKR